MFVGMVALRPPPHHARVCPPRTVATMIIWLFTAAAIVANTVFVWPQAARLLRERDTAGVSPGTWTISVVLFSVWSAYAASTGFWALCAANLSCLGAAVVVMYVGTRSGWAPRWAVLSAVGVILAALGGFLLPVALAVVMTGAGVALRVPQLLMLVRSKSVANVSVTTWLLSGATAACWLIVSLSRGATAVIIANSSALAATLVLLGVLLARTGRCAAALSTSPISVGSSTGYLRLKTHSFVEGVCVADNDGYIRITGRKKDLIIRCGENIAATEVESVIRAYPGVKDVAVVAMPNERMGECACAYLVKAAGAPNIDLKSLKDFFIERGVAKHKIPEWLEIVDVLPMTPAGKVRKDELRQRIAAQIESEASQESKG